MVTDSANVIPIEPYLPLYTRGLALHRSGGLPRGSATGWPSIDQLYTVGAGQWTVITGMPGSGKSEWLDALLVNLAEQERWRFAVYSPENYPTETHLAKLCEKRARKPFNVGLTPRMTEAEYGVAALWVMDRFIWLDTALKTPDELISTALSFRTQGERFGVVLDPWNTLEHQRGGMTETDYVSFILTEVTKLARASDAHVWLVVHPAKIPRNKDGSRPAPTPYDISGSAHWYNKADNIVCVHRDQAEDDQRVEIHVQKVRFKHIGRMGLVELKYDRVTGRYFESRCMGMEVAHDPERGQAPPPPREPGEDD
jgi:twinkle protein